MHILQRDQPAWLATRSQGIEAKRLTVPCRRRAHGRAANRRPAHLGQRVLKLSSIALAVAEKDSPSPLWDHRAQQLDDRDMEGLGTRPFGALAHAPRQRQGAPLQDHVDPQGHTATADDTAIHDPDQRLEGSMCP